MRTGNRTLHSHAEQLTGSDLAVSHRWYAEILNEGGLFVTRLTLPDGAPLQLDIRNSPLTQQLHSVGMMRTDLRSEHQATAAPSIA